MYYRRKVLLGLLELAGGEMQRTDLQKLLMLFCKTQQEPAYEFVPYKFGAFSFQSYADKRALTKYGYLQEGDEWQLTDKAKGIWSTLKDDDLYGIKSLLRQLDGKRGKALVRETYLKYPYYAIHSEIAESVLNADELQKVKAARTHVDQHALLTIGYEGISLEAYLNKLIQANVKLLCDVRKNPLSMKWGFSKKQLSESCNRVGIEYLHIPELGIVSDKRKSLDTQADYDRLFEEYECTTLIEQKAALDKLVKLIDEHGRVAITCFEACEQQCHRGRVAKALENRPKREFEVMHL
ncbi:MAG: DUF488 domain-containing protein [Flavobacteriales bacterium]|nr:DUF488 domain-containing protein [Flavobacteriales bacterium]MCB9203876.1 DUF488 domain-containing protein [Flavobacteriales bacterium]